MSGVDHLRAARDAMGRYRAEAVCGTCREDADAVIDLLDKDIEFEGLMRQYVAVGMQHPKAAQVGERSRQIGGARDEVKKRLGIGGRESGAAVGIARSWREDLGGLVPHPLGILSPPQRRRT